MSCSICLESYLDHSRVPDGVERLQYLRLEKENTPPNNKNFSQCPKSPQSCCFFRAKDPNTDKESQDDGLLLDPEEQRRLIESQAVANPKCGHVFHLGCITQWCSDSANSKDKWTCPMCRETIVLKKLVKLHLDTHVIIRQNNTGIGGVLVSMSLNQYNTLKDGFTVGYHNAEEKFQEVHQERIDAEKNLKEQEIFKLKTENADEIKKLTAKIEKLETENATAIRIIKLKSDYINELKKVADQAQ